MAQSRVPCSASLSSTGRKRQSNTMNNGKSTEATLKSCSIFTSVTELIKIEIIVRKAFGDGSIVICIAVSSIIERTTITMFSR